MQMKLYKVITTVCWKFEADKNEEEALEYAKQQLDKILQVHPQGEAFEGFSVQVDLAHMKERKKLVHLSEFRLDEVFPFITVEESKQEFKVGEQSYFVRMSSDRYHVFKANPNCVSCGLAGNKLILDMNPGDQSPHFNLYAEEDGRLVLMTKDHVLAKSKGGTDDLSNFQTMCCVCNNLKGCYDLTIDNTRELREIFNNSGKLPRKEIRDRINVRREEMAKKLFGECRDIGNETCCQFRVGTQCSNGNHPIGCEFLDDEYK